MRFSLKLLFWVSTLAVFVAASVRICGEAKAVFLSALVLPFVVSPHLSVKRGLLTTLATWSLILTSILTDKNFALNNGVSHLFLGLWMILGVPLSAAWNMLAMILTSLAHALWLGNTTPAEWIVDSRGALPEDGNRVS